MKEREIEMLQNIHIKKSRLCRTLNTNTLVVYQFQQKVTESGEEGGEGYVRE
jgi:hypothetical protein